MAAEPTRSTRRATLGRLTTAQGVLLGTPAAVAFEQADEVLRLLTGSVFPATRTP